MRSENIRVGFHRLGIALAVVPLITAIGTYCVGLFNWAGPLVMLPALEIAHKGSGRSFVITYSSNPGEMGKQMASVFSPGRVPGSAPADLDAEVLRVDRLRQDGIATLLFGLVALVVAACAYGASRIVGWVLSGFVAGRD